MRAVLLAIVIFVAASVLVAKTLLHRARPAVLTTPVARESTPEPMSTPAVPASKLPIELIGTIVRVEGSLATLKVASHDRTNVFEKSPIEKLAIVRKIERERIYFTNLATGLEESVRIRPYDASLAVSAEAMNRPGDRKEFHVSRTTVDQQLQNLPQLLMSATAVPVTDSSGRIHGFRIQSLDEKSFFKELGLQPGDVLTEVNGTKLESVEGVTKLFNELRASSMIQLNASRQSRDLQLTYLIR